MRDARWPMLCILLVLLISSGCARFVWIKSGATQQDFARDSYECERDMRQSRYFGGGIAGALNAQAFQERCMVARGWTKARQE